MIPVAKPWIGENEANAARRPILAGWVTQGPEVAAFEKEFASAVGASHACAVSNCTTALHLALRAVGVDRDDEVATVSHSFIATASSIRYCGAIPVFVDIDPATYNLDPARLESAITNRTKAILCVHQMGMPCDLDSITAIARHHGLPVIEDAACAAGSEILWNGAWERIGKPHGTIACFSFHPRKLITTGDGGMLTTADPELDAKFRLWRQHSMSVSDAVRHQANQVVFEEYPEIGYNYRLSDIQAAVGREQLKRLPEIVERRRSIAKRYRELLEGADGLHAPIEPTYTRTNWQSFCVRLEPWIDQREVMQRMLDKGVSTRRGIMCAHRERAYAVPGSWRCGARGCAESCCSKSDCNEQPSSCVQLRESETAQDHSIILPLFHDMTEEQQQEVTGALRSAVSASSTLALTGSAR